MQLRSLGDSGLLVSNVALGTMSWGTETDIHEARDCLRDFIDAGGNFIDTSDAYAEGGAEEILAELLHDEGIRPNVVLASSAGQVAGAREFDGSRRHLVASLNSSLKRLGTDHLDLWYVSGFDSITPVEETVATMQEAVSDGKVRYLAVSANAAWQFALASSTARHGKSGIGIVAAQTKYSLLQRSAEFELMPAARLLTAGIVACSPLAHGVLTGKYRFGTPADSRGASPSDRSQLSSLLTGRARSIVDAVCTAAEGLGVAPLEVALAWVLNRPGIASCVVGARTVGQLRSAISVDENLLPSEINQALTDVSSPSNRGDLANEGN